MQRTVSISAAAMLLCGSFALAQQSSGQGVPLYRVTVVSRSTKAINYQYRSEPTPIDFRGTVLLPDAKGDALVSSKKGRTEINAKFEKLPPPERFGREYMSYVLWAITPEGNPQAIGEIVPNASNKASLTVTTDLQAFALIVTAEPYPSVRQPSDVVVLENEVRPDTTGTIKDVVAKYELMPRGQYTWHVPDELESQVSSGPKVSMDRYEALLALGQAQNAIGIAQTAGADKYAPNTMADAKRLLENARQMNAVKGSSKRVVQSAKEAVQTAEDARLIAERRSQQEKVATAEANVAEAREAQRQAERLATQARIDASNARAQAQAEHAASEQAMAQLNAERRQAAENAAAQAQATAVQAQADRMENAALEAEQRHRQEMAARGNLRMRLLEEMNGAVSTRDTPRGLVMTIQDGDFQGAALRPNTAQELRRVAAIVAAHPGLKIEVEGNSDSAATSATAQQRADHVREVLIAAGVQGSMVTARDLGDSRLLVSNATSDGRVENRRVEIVLTGDPIGNMPFWDHTYNLKPR